MERVKVKIQDMNLFHLCLCVDFQKSQHLLDKRTTDVSDAQAIYDYSQEWVKSKVIMKGISHFFKLHLEFCPFFFPVQTYAIKEYLDSSRITEQL